MALFGKSKRERIEEERALAQQQRMQQAMAQLDQHLDQDPSFQLCTFDGLHWLDPFTGNLVSAPFDFKQAARLHFNQHRHWMRGQPKPIVDLRTIIWLQYLEDKFKEDKRLQFFAKDGRWLNPFNGKLNNAVKKVQGRVTPQVLRKMARALAAHERAHPERFLRYEDLQERFPTLAPERKVEENEIGDDIISADDFDNMDQWESLGDVLASGEEKAPASERAKTEPADTPPPPPASAVGDEPRVGGLELTPPEEPQDPAEVAPTRAIQREDRQPPTAAREKRPPPSFDPPPLPSAGRTSTPTALDPALELSAEPSQESDVSSDEYLASDAMDQEETRQGDTASPTPRPRTATDVEQEQAREVQRHLMGKVPAIDGVDIGLHFQPLQHLGGDFYYFIRLSEQQHCFIVGDVSGHGAQAALVVGTILKSLQFMFKVSSTADLPNVMARLNDDVQDQLVAGQFFTAFAGILTTGTTNKLECVCAGCHPAICINDRGPEFMRQVGKKGMALGLSTNDVVSKRLMVSTEHFIPGDTLCVYTDGVHEVMDRTCNEYGHWRTRGSFLANIEKGAQEMAESVAAEATAFANDQTQDDMTVLTIRFN